jgi:hypothetical protein
MVPIRFYWNEWANQKNIRDMVGLLIRGGLVIMNGGLGLMGGYLLGAIQTDDFNKEFN